MIRELKYACRIAALAVALGVVSVCYATVRGRLIWFIPAHQTSATVDSRPVRLRARRSTDHEVLLVTLWRSRGAETYWIDVPEGRHWYAADCPARSTLLPLFFVSRLVRACPPTHSAESDESHYSLLWRKLQPTDRHVEFTAGDGAKISVAW